MSIPQELAFDFRSDTVTQPDEAMRQAMLTAPLGDDVFGEDPTVNALQTKMAQLTGHDAGLFFPSGCMANLTALMCHAEPGSLLFSGGQSHIKLYELGSSARLAGLVQVDIDDQHGWLDLDQLRKLWPPDIYYLAQPGVITVENTHNILGGLIYPLEQLADLASFANSVNTPLHMDGARLFNAAVATGFPISAWTRHVDSVMMCFSKSLGAPVGSMLTGSAVLIEKARRIRKLLGGGMRQAGILAAAGLYALENHLPLLDRDHQRCLRVSEGLSNLPWLEVVHPQSNILIYDLDRPVADAYVAYLAEQGLQLLAIGPQKVRAVFHRHISDEATEQLVQLTRTWEP